MFGVAARRFAGRRGWRREAASIAMAGRARGGPTTARPAADGAGGSHERHRHRRTALARPPRGAAGPRARPFRRRPVLHAAAGRPRRRRRQGRTPGRRSRPAMGPDGRGARALVVHARAQQAVRHAEPQAPRGARHRARPRPPVGRARRELPPRSARPHGARGCGFARRPPRPHRGPHLGVRPGGPLPRPGRLRGDRGSDRRAPPPVQPSARHHGPAADPHRHLDRRQPRGTLCRLRHHGGALAARRRGGRRRAAPDARRRAHRRRPVHDGGPAARLFGVLGTVRQPAGSRIPTAAPTSAYPCADGKWIVLAANSQPPVRPARRPDEPARPCRRPALRRPMRHASPTSTRSMG